MNQFSTQLHIGNNNFKKQFLRISLLLFFISHIGIKTNAQCDANPVANQIVCNNTATTAINFTGTGTTFNWVNNNTSIGLAASGTGNIAAFTALNATATAVTATITVTPSNGACTGAPISFTITVNPSPVVNVTPVISCGGIPGIGGNCIPLTASGNADIYIWSPLAGLYQNCQVTIAYAGNNLAAVYPAPSLSTIYTVTGTITATGCTSAATAQVNNTPPAPVITPASVNMCIGDPAVKLKVVAGIPATPAVWSPAAGLFRDAFAVIPYIPGTAVDSVWVRPIPAGVYPYQVTTQGQAFPLCTPTTNFTATNVNATVTFNLRNNHTFPIKLTQIDSRTFTAATSNVTVYYKAGAINTPPGAISAANGWNLFGVATINGNGSSVQPFLSNLYLLIPAGTTYGICLQAVTGLNAPNLSYSALIDGNYTFNDGGCELITGTNIGYSGTNIPAAPTTALSGFVGAVHFTDASTTCTSPPRTVVVTVSQPYSINTQPVNQTSCVNSSALFTAGVTGTGPATFQWQVSTNGGLTFNNVNNVSPYSGVNTPTLVINPVSAAMNGYLYRLSINGGSGSCGTISSAALLTVGQAFSITTQPVNQTLCGSGVAVFTVGVTGTGPFAYQWQVSTNGGGVYTNIVNAGPYSGVNTATLTVDPATVAMNGYLYKVAVNGGCSVATSSAALLTVNPLPTIVITANPLIIGPGQKTTIFSTVTPNPAATYTWYYNGAVLTGATADTLLVNYGSVGDYQLKVTDVNGCINLSNIISIANSFSFNLFTYPNPSTGRFQVSYNSLVNKTVQRSLIIYNNWGDKIIIKNFTQTIPYQKVDVDVRANGKGLYWVELRDGYGRRLAISRVVVQ